MHKIHLYTYTKYKHRPIIYSTLIPKHKKCNKVFYLSKKLPGKYQEKGSFSATQLSYRRNIDMSQLKLKHDLLTCTHPIEA